MDVVFQGRKLKREAQLWEEARVKLIEAGVADDIEDDVVIDITEFNVMEVDSNGDSIYSTVQNNDGISEASDASKVTNNIILSSSLLGDLERLPQNNYQDNSNTFENRSFRQSTDVDISGLDKSNSNRDKHACIASVENARDIICANSQELDFQAVELDDIEYSKSQVASVSLEISKKRNPSELETLRLGSLNLNSFRKPPSIVEKDTLPHEISQISCDNEFLSCDTEISNGEISFTTIDDNASQETHDTDYLSCDELTDDGVQIVLNNSHENNQNNNAFVNADDNPIHSYPDNVSQETNSQQTDDNSDNNVDNSDKNVDNSDKTVDNSSQSLPASGNTSASVISGRRIFEPMFYHEQLKNF
ncbi:uncharacterized protein DDB_G0287625-like, partial [Cotesia glomerata]|uniref:uncharacterized protein DDB_G0287625-like n=1 Tax=Cotesia glomerata TaxID=32391 RepID=UPI001D0142E8